MDTVSLIVNNEPLESPVSCASHSRTQARGYAGCCFVEPVDEEVDSTFRKQPEDEVIDEILNMFPFAALEDVMIKFLIKGQSA